ncbi:hypothetical protein FE257_000341 [Aspergillus nanangensis]|uniref:Uncharacterized protein n=1 Tax=Aspergillus nanangensis TaxID=2582783 RepID=A0AAD4H057_ASPNN|nr:hypothetical protein FE257_000341 [Aspergillus nanangensis]
MHTSQILYSAISALVFLSPFQLSAASPVEIKENQLEKRCDNPCGFYDQVCCTSGQTCGTNDANEAICVDGNGGGGGGDGAWEYYTTIYTVTETDKSTVTSVWSSYVSKPTGGASGSCKGELGETQCGNDCCGAAYVCSNSQCVLGSSSIWATATAKPPVRGTSASTVTATASATTTQGFDAPVGTDGAALIGVHAEGGGLSGGAIAGIVIGTIAGVFLLLLVCACLCCKGALEALFACLGLGKRKRKETTTYVEGHHSHHSHHGGPGGRTWFGARPHASSSSGGEKKSKWSSLATIGIILGALTLCLGLKRRRDHDEKSDTSHPSSYYYYSDYYTNPSSSESSDSRTRYTRRSRRSGRSRSRRS